MHLAKFQPPEFGFRFMSNEVTMLGGHGNSWLSGDDCKEIIGFWQHYHQGPSTSVLRTLLTFVGSLSGWDY